MSLQLQVQVPLLQVFDMPASLAFYVDFLGFEIAMDSGVRDTPEGRFAHWVLLRCGEGQLMLNTAYDEGERPLTRDAARWGGHGDVCVYFGCADVDAAYALLAAKDPALTAPARTPHGTRQIMLHDPDGYGVCLQARA